MKNLPGKIVFVDTADYEKILLEMALLQKQWKATLEHFTNALDALTYLKNTKDEIFLVISEIKIPQMSGLEFKKSIDKDPKLREKAIPFIFTADNITKEQVSEAYDYRVQGCFEKSHTISGQAQQLDLIIKYWINSIHPSEVK